MEEKELNFVDRFLYKLLIGAFLLLAVVFFGRIGVIDLEKVRASLSEHYNILKVIRSINGENRFLLPMDITDTVSGEVSALYMTGEKIPDGLRIEVNEFQGVEVYKTGVVVAIIKNKNGTYQVKVKGIDDYTYVYDRLASVDCNIYKIVTSGEIIGAPTAEDAGCYFHFYVYDEGMPVNLFLK
ncbi:MAG TPA: M23 family metallopeptidase [Acholeplasmataceae bacterium]|nr:M23 family metallopeptidase [Acholeplasmataceae bacterium]